MADGVAGTVDRLLLAGPARGVNSRPVRAGSADVGRGRPGEASHRRAAPYRPRPDAIAGRSAEPMAPARAEVAGRAGDWSHPFGERARVLLHLVHPHAVQEAERVQVAA